MKVNLHSVLKCTAATALLFAFLLVFNATGVAGASAAPVAKVHPDVVNPCITASPLTQTVIVNNYAAVVVTVNCLPTSITALPYVSAAWGDGVVSSYALCSTVCHAPPIIIDTRHAYSRVGVFHPVFCLQPTPTPTDLYCTSVTVTVIAPPPV